MPEPRRLPPDDVRERVLQGDALLVCAYADEDKCESVRLTGALTLGELPEPFPDDRLVVFYCA